jgi:hypothetical protein
MVMRTLVYVRFGPQVSVRRRVAAAVIVPCLLLTPLALRRMAGRSVMRLGAGNRALSLGGAFVGIAGRRERAPCGTGRWGSQRMEVSSRTPAAAQRQPQGTGPVLPELALKRSGSALRRERIGARRRNLLLGNLTDAEAGVTIGYGRALGPARSLGAGSKSTPDLAGFSGSGLGADRGCWCVPASCWGCFP